jgi:hypothetical protein
LRSKIIFGNAEILFIVYEEIVVVGIPFGDTCDWANYHVLAEINEIDET